MVETKREEWKRGIGLNIKAVRVMMENGKGEF